MGTMMTRWRITLACLAVLAAAGPGLSAAAWGSDAKHGAKPARAAKNSPYAQQCAAIWPQYLRADISDGIEMDDPLTPADIANSKQAFFMICLSKGPNAPEIQGMLH